MCVCSEETPLLLGLTTVVSELMSGPRMFTKVTNTTLEASKLSAIWLLLLLFQFIKNMHIHYIYIHTWGWGYVEVRR